MADHLIMYYVYVLKLSNGSFYKGQTFDLEQRLNDHKSKSVKTTRNKLPFELVHVEICRSRNEARNLEIYFKSGFGREIIKLILDK